MAELHHGHTLTTSFQPQPSSLIAIGHEIRALPPVRSSLVSTVTAVRIRLTSPSSFPPRTSFPLHLLPSDHPFLFHVSISSLVSPPTTSPELASLGRASSFPRSATQSSPTPYGLATFSAHVSIESQAAINPDFTSGQATPFPFLPRTRPSPPPSTPPCHGRPSRSATEPSLPPDSSKLTSNNNNSKMPHQSGQDLTKPGKKRIEEEFRRDPCRAHQPCEPSHRQASPLVHSISNNRNNDYLSSLPWENGSMDSAINVFQWALKALPGQEDDESTTIQSRPLPRDVFRVRQMQRTRGVSTSQTGSAASGGSALSGDQSASTG